MINSVAFKNDNSSHSEEWNKNAVVSCSIFDFINVSSAPSQSSSVDLVLCLHGRSQNANIFLDKSKKVILEQFCKRKEAFNSGEDVRFEYLDAPFSLSSDEKAECKTYFSGAHALRTWRSPCEKYDQTFTAENLNLLSSVTYFEKHPVTFSGGEANCVNMKATSMTNNECRSAKRMRDLCASLPFFVPPEYKYSVARVLLYISYSCSLSIRRLFLCGFSEGCTIALLSALVIINSSCFLSKKLCGILLAAPPRLSLASQVSSGNNGNSFPPALRKLDGLRMFCFLGLSDDITPLSASLATLSECFSKIPSFNLKSHKETPYCVSEHDITICIHSAGHIFPYVKSCLPDLLKFFVYLKDITKAPQNIVNVDEFSLTGVSDKIFNAKAQQSLSVPSTEILVACLGTLEIELEIAGSVYANGLIERLYQSCGHSLIDSRPPLLSKDVLYELFSKAVLIAGTPESPYLWASAADPGSCKIARLFVPLITAQGLEDAGVPPSYLAAHIGAGNQENSVFAPSAVVVFDFSASYPAEAPQITFITDFAAIAEPLLTAPPCSLFPRELTANKLFKTHVDTAIKDLTAPLLGEMMVLQLCAALGDLLTPFLVAFYAHHGGVPAALAAAGLSEALGVEDEKESNEALQDTCWEYVMAEGAQTVEEREAAIVEARATVAAFLMGVEGEETELAPGGKNRAGSLTPFWRTRFRLQHSAHSRGSRGGAMVAVEGAPSGLSSAFNITVGFVGKPSCGKSSLFNAILNSDVAKVGAYPFTTINPNIVNTAHLVACTEGSSKEELQPSCCRIMVPCPCANYYYKALGTCFSPDDGRVGQQCVCDSPLPDFKASQCTRTERPQGCFYDGRLSSTCRMRYVGSTASKTSNVSSCGGMENAHDERGSTSDEVCFNHFVFKDIAGLVKGAYKGRGKGNKFLNDITDVDVILHVVDGSGSADAEGNVIFSKARSQGISDSGGGGAGGLEGASDPVADVEWVRNELHSWIFDNVAAKLFSRNCKEGPRRWVNGAANARKKADQFIGLFTGYHATPLLVLEVLGLFALWKRRQMSTGERTLPQQKTAGPFEVPQLTEQEVLDIVQALTPRELHLLVALFLYVRFPMVIAVNKHDIDPVLVVNNAQRIAAANPLDFVAVVSAKAEREAERLAASGKDKKLQNPSCDDCVRLGKGAWTVSRSSLSAGASQDTTFASYLHRTLSYGIQLLLLRVVAAANPVIVYCVPSFRGLEAAGRTAAIRQGMANLQRVALAESEKKIYPCISAVFLVRQGTTPSSIAALLSAVTELRSAPPPGGGTRVVKKKKIVLVEVADVVYESNADVLMRQIHRGDPVASSCPERTDGVFLHIVTNSKEDG